MGLIELSFVTAVFVIGVVTFTRVAKLFIKAVNAFFDKIENWLL